MTEAERRTALEALGAEVRACTRCRLAEGRTQAVPGEGHPSTEVMFVGEGPGLNEDRQGRPFVGAAGQFLDELLASVGWSRAEVFITNVVKCRPPQNRDPEPDEIEACAPFLRRQLEVLDPALVVTLGRHSMGRFLPGARIGQVHGTFRSAPTGSGIGDGLVFAMYHPAAALHQGSLRQTLLDDMGQVPTALIEARRRRAAGPVQDVASLGAGMHDAAPAVATEVGATEAAVDMPTAAEPEQGLAAADVADAASDGTAPATPAGEEPGGRAGQDETETGAAPDTDSAPAPPRPTAAAEAPSVDDGGDDEPVESWRPGEALELTPLGAEGVPDDQMTLFHA